MMWLRGGGVFILESFRAGVQGPDLRRIGRSCFSSQKSKIIMPEAELLLFRALFVFWQKVCGISESSDL